MQIDGEIAVRYAKRVHWSKDAPGSRDVELNLRCKQIVEVASFSDDVLRRLTDRYSDIAAGRPAKEAGEEEGDGPVRVVGLNLSNNHLRIFSPSMMVLASSLQVLNLSRNLLGSLSDSEQYSRAALPCLRELPALEELNLSQNKLMFIPSSVAALTTLHKLDLSMNRLQTARGLEGMLQLQVLQLHGNELQDLSGLEGLQSLCELYVHRNKITDATAVGLLSAQHLQTLNLSLNLIEDGQAMVRSLVTLKGLHTLHLKGNPMADDDTYRLVLVDACEELQLLDGHRVGQLLKQKIERRLQQTEEQHEDLTFESLVDQTTEEYSTRIRMELEHKSYILDLLNKKRREIEDEFREYERTMNAELADALRFLHTLEHDKSKALDKSEGAIAAWTTRLQELSHDRKATATTMQHSRKNMEQDRLFSRAKIVSFNEKLYEISMKRPDLWRQMKARELSLHRQEEEQEEEEQAQKRREGVDLTAGKHQGGLGAMRERQGIQAAVAHSSVLHALPLTNGHLQLDGGSQVLNLRSNSRSKAGRPRRPSRPASDQA